MQLLFLALLGGVVWLVYQYLQNTPAITAPLGVFLSSSTFTVLGIGGIVLIVIVGFLARMLRRTVLGRPLSGLLGILITIGIVVVFLWITFLNPQVSMTRTGFSTTSVSIFAHNKVTFQNPANGVTQILCIGTNQQCEPAASADGPKEFGRGLVIQPGQSVNVEFDSGGNYYITSKNTPHMNLKVVVTEGGGD